MNFSRSISCFRRPGAIRWIAMAHSLLVLTAMALPVCAQVASSPQATPNQSAPNQLVPSKPEGTVNIDQYIHEAWGVLSRSMTDCHSLVDTKLTTRPVLYLPAEMPIPPEVAALKTACGVTAQHLPKRIDHPGALMPNEIPTPGLLYLPNKYVVPGGRFNEMYGWDSYFIVLGLLEDEHRDIARGMVENFFFEIEHYGNILNANRTYYLTRSQPPLLSSMIRDVYQADISATPQAYRKADAWLAQAYGYAVRDHALWLTPAHQAGDTGLARYHDLGNGPVPEMEDASTYYPDIIHWLLAHPDVKTDYLVDGPDVPAGEVFAAIDELARTSCDPRKSKVCARAHVGTHWLSKAYFEGDRADRESGFDPTFRFGPFAGSTDHFAPSCLNSLLYKYELDLAWMAARLNKPAEAATWKQQAAARKVAIDKYLWNASRGLYFDYDTTTHQQSSYVYISTFYPLWAGASSPEQSKAVAANIKLLLQPGGLSMSNTSTGLQWDLPYGWAPTMWFAVAGLVKTGDMADAVDASKRFLRTVETGYDQDHTVREKYDVVGGTAEVNVATGYKMNVVGFGWTNGVYLKFKHLVAAPKADAAAVVE